MLGTLSNRRRRRWARRIAFAVPVAIGCIVLRKRVAFDIVGPLSAISPPKGGTWIEPPGPAQLLSHLAFSFRDRIEGLQCDPAISSTPPQKRSHRALQTADAFKVPDETVPSDSCREPMGNIELSAPSHPATTRHTDFECSQQIPSYQYPFPLASPPNPPAHSMIGTSGKPFLGWLIVVTIDALDEYARQIAQIQCYASRRGIPIFVEYDLAGPDRDFYHSRHFNVFRHLFQFEVRSFACLVEYFLSLVWWRRRSGYLSRTRTCSSQIL